MLNSGLHFHICISQREGGGGFADVSPEYNLPRRPIRVVVYNRRTLHELGVKVMEQLTTGSVDLTHDSNLVSIVALCRLRVSNLA